MNICTWNVRTLEDNGNQLERKTAIIDRELARHNITIAALSETREGFQIHFFCGLANQITNPDKPV